MNTVQTIILSLLLGAIGGMVAQVLLNLNPPMGSPVVGSKMAGREVRAQGVNGKSAVVMSISDKGQPVLSLIDKEGKQRALLSIDDQNGSFLKLFHSDGTTRAFMNVGSDGRPSVGISNENGRAGAIMELSKNDKPAFIVRTRGTMRGIMCVSEIGPSINLLDDDGTLRAVIGQAALLPRGQTKRELTPPGSITLFDKAGHVVWKAPGEAADIEGLDSTPFLPEMKGGDKTKAGADEDKSESSTEETDTKPKPKAKPKPKPKAYSEEETDVN